MNRLGGRGLSSLQQIGRSQSRHLNWHILNIITKMLSALKCVLNFIRNAFVTISVSGPFTTA